MHRSCLVLALSASAALAAPVPQVEAGSPCAPFVWTPAQIAAAAPGSSSCVNSTNTSCRTAEQAAPFINAAFEKYGFHTAGEQAAILSLMAFETADFEFDINMFPGRPGQGTRNMMMFPFILQYALEEPTTAAEVNAIAPQLTLNTTQEEANLVPADTMNQIRALVLGDELSFASASWFLRTKCEPEIATALQGRTDQAYNDYMLKCIFTGEDPTRLVGYKTALAAVGL